MTQLRSYFAAVSLTLIGSLPATASILHIDSAATGANDGSSWADALTDLQSGLGIAVAGDSLWVAAGSYRPTANTDPTATFQLRSGVTVLGGFSATETEPDERDPSANPTILSGDIGVAGQDSDNSYHVVTASGADSTSVLDGFTLTKGWAFGGGADNAGGGMINVGGNAVLHNLVFVDNQAFELGGGMANLDGARPTLQNVFFSSNASAYVGGGHGQSGQ